MTARNENMDDKERVRRIACLLDIVRDLAAEVTAPKPREILNGLLDDDRLTETIIYLEQAYD
jgi:hypothetical protein